MTDRSKFEQMLEHLINEDEQKAKELFHDIVVAKSREIYETLISEDFDEGMMPDEMPAEEPEMEASDEFSGDDATDDMMGDIEGGDEEEGGDMGGDDVSLSGGDVDELQDRVVDLEDALDALRDEFESLMGGEEGGDDMGGDDMGDEPVPEMDGMSQEMPAMEVRDDDEDEDNNNNTDEAFIREYVEKVTAAKGGDDGANTKSTVAKKNDMGGTSGNLNKAFADNGKGGTQGGLLNPSTKDLNSGNVNVPGGKAGVKHLKTVSGGHGAEKKSTGDNGANTNSPINGAPGRAK
jgi:hypothetical protein